MGIAVVFVSNLNASKEDMSNLARALVGNRYARHGACPLLTERGIYSDDPTRYGPFAVRMLPPGVKDGLDGYIDEGNPLSEIRGDLARSIFYAILDERQTLIGVARYMFETLVLRGIENPDVFLYLLNDIMEYSRAYEGYVFSPESDMGRRLGEYLVNGNNPAELVQEIQTQIFLWGSYPGSTRARVKQMVPWTSDQQVDELTEQIEDRLIQPGPCTYESYMQELTPMIMFPVEPL